jgi:hypothetical protein
MAEKSCFYFLKIYLKNFNFLFFLLQIKFFSVFRSSWYVDFKNNFKKNIYYFNIFLNKKHFKKQPKLHSQTCSGKLHFCSYKFINAPFISLYLESPNVTLLSVYKRYYNSYRDLRGKMREIKTYWNKLRLKVIFYYIL